VFDWLRKMKVKKIMKIIVTDNETRSHDNETIQNALEGFEVESWDWKRNDIPSSVIANSSSVVRDVTLYYSGKPTVLKEWCGNNGFGDSFLFPEVNEYDLRLIKTANILGYVQLRSINVIHDKVSD
jgi:hypothetical protein